MRLRILILCLTISVLNSYSQNTFYVSGGGNTVYINNSHVVHSDGDLNNLSSGVIVLGSTGEPNLEVDGHFDNATDATFTAGTGLLELTGSSNQNIDLGGDDLYNLEIVNSAGATITDPVTVNNEIQFNTGDFTTDATNFITFGTSASATGAADGSHIIGPVAKNFNSTTNFTFPTGDGTSLNTIGFEPDGTGGTTMKAEYLFTQPSSRNSKGAGITKVSNLEQWSLSRESGSENGDITLEWDATSDVTTHTDLLVAGWDGSQWVNRGSATFTGNATSGTVKSSSVSSFGNFTIGTSTAVNALPVEFLEFTATLENDEIVLKWITATEVNNDFFEVERSDDGVNFYSIGTVNSNGDGNSTEIQNYEFIDNKPLVGSSFYRLKQVDFDGEFDYSEIEKIELEDAEMIVVYPNPSEGLVNLVVYANQSSSINVDIYDGVGQLVKSDLIIVFEGDNYINNYFEGAKGKYYISVTMRNGDQYGYPFVIVK